MIMFSSNVVSLCSFAGILRGGEERGAGIKKIKGGAGSGGGEKIVKFRGAGSGVKNRSPPNLVILLSSI